MLFIIRTAASCCDDLTDLQTPACWSLSQPFYHQDVALSSRIFSCRKLASWQMVVAHCSVPVLSTVSHSHQPPRTTCSHHARSHRICCSALVHRSHTVTGRRRAAGAASSQQSKQQLLPAAAAAAGSRPPARPSSYSQPATSNPVAAVSARSVASYYCVALLQPQSALAAS
eukprot:SAG25_NODE_3499_length_1060_cov_68.216566_2_plen_171_part_00